MLNILTKTLAEGKGFADFLDKTGGGFEYYSELAGSMGPDIRLRYRNPVELGWAGIIKFDHDFVGRKALTLNPTVL